MLVPLYILNITRFKFSRNVHECQFFLFIFISYTCMALWCLLLDSGFFIFPDIHRSMNTMEHVHSIRHHVNFVRDLFHSKFDKSQKNENQYLQITLTVL